LRNIQAQFGGAYDDEDAVIFTLASGTQVTAPMLNCGGFDLQVVEWEGVTVERGEVPGGMAAMTTSAVVSLPQAMRPVVALQAQTSRDVAVNICNLMVRARMRSASELEVTRSAGDPGCATEPIERIAYERIDFGNRAMVHQASATFTPGTTEVVVPLPMPFDPQRSFLWASNHSTMGQGGGESRVAITSQVSASAFELTFDNALNVRVLRRRPFEQAIVTFYAVQIE
jgi:hypothetical protein